MVSALTKIKDEVKKNIFDSINYVLSKRRIALATYNFHTNRHIFALVTHIKENIGIAMTIPEGVQIYLCAHSVENIPGDAAEAGVFKGGTAAIIAEALEKKKIHLFDTFAGLPDTTIHDGEFRKGQYIGTFQEVKNNLKKYKKMEFYQGIFPKTGVKVQNKKFAFVHLDLDLYKGTKESLEFFYPRMSKGGIILLHDYPQVSILKALKEFFKDKLEKPIVLAGAQCMIVKV